MIRVIDAATGDTLPGFASQTLLAIARLTSTPRLAYQRADGAWLPTSDDAGELLAEGYKVARVVLQEHDPDAQCAEHGCARHRCDESH